MPGSDDSTRDAPPRATPTLSAGVVPDANTASEAAHPTDPVESAPPGSTGVPAAADSIFTLLAEIARGGMGVVYRARDESLGREVAVKTVQGGFAPGSLAARRFLDESRITGQLQHPGIPPVYQSGTLPDGRPFLAMKLIKGLTLDELVRARPDRGRLLAAFEHVCQAVGYAHAHGVIHRDLKPSNVMVGGFGEVQVMDWGLAKVLGGRGDETEADPGEIAAGTVVSTEHDGDEATRAGAILGTPAYMPPEQAIGAIDQIDCRSDVFGLGGILATVLTGKPPFVGEHAESIRQSAARGKVGDCFARLDACGADPEWVELCKRCLAPEKADRPADAEEVAETVAGLRGAADERARQAELDRVRAEGDRARAEAEAREQRKRRRVQLALAGAVMLLVAGGGAFVWYADRQATEDAAKKRDEEARGRTERERRESLTEREVGAALAEMAALCDRGDRETENPPRWRLTLDAARSAYQRADAAVKAGPASEESAERVRGAGERLTRDEFDCETARLYEVWTEDFVRAIGGNDPGPFAADLIRRAEGLLDRVTPPAAGATPQARSAAVRSHRLRYTATAVAFWVDRMKAVAGEKPGGPPDALTRLLTEQTHPLQASARLALADGTVRTFLAGEGRSLTSRELICLAIGLSSDPDTGRTAGVLFETALARNPADLMAMLPSLGRYGGGRFLKTDPKTGITWVPPRDAAPRAFRVEDIRRLATAEAAIALRPDLSSAWLSSAQCLADGGYPALAADRYREAVRLAPDNVEAHVFFAETLDRARRAAEAVEVYRAALARFPRLPPTKSPFADLGTNGTPFRMAAARAALFLARDAGAETARLSDAEKAGLRRDALRWLGEWLVEGARYRLDLFLLNRDPAFRLVRDPELQNQLPADEQPGWRDLSEKIRSVRTFDNTRYMLVGDPMEPPKPAPPLAPEPRPKP